MTKFVISLMMLSLIGSSAAFAKGELMLGTTEVADPPIATDECSGTYLKGHDGSFEGAYAWQGQGSGPAPEGAFAESFLLEGDNTVTCARLALTTEPGTYQGQSLDLYIWEGGINGDPGAVLFVSPGLMPTSLPYYPGIGVNDFDVDFDVPPEFSIGYWGDYTGGHGFYLWADQNGAFGHPWTYYSATSGYPMGWGDPALAFAQTNSMGIGIFFEDAGGTSGIPEDQIDRPPQEPTTWGAIKGQFK